MKIDSVKNFAYALFHPFHDKVEVTKLQRVALAILSTLLIVPILYAGISTLANRISKKDSKQKEELDAKIADAAEKALLLAKEYEELNDILGAEDGPSKKRAFESLLLRRDINWVLRGLAQIKPNQENELDVVKAYEWIGTNAKYRIDAPIVSDCIQGVMRFKETNYEAVSSALASIGKLMKPKMPKIRTLTEKIQQGLREMKPRNSEELGFKINALLELGRDGRTQDLKIWALEEFLNQKFDHRLDNKTDVIIMIGLIAKFNASLTYEDRDQKNLPLTKHNSYEVGNIAIKGLVTFFKGMDRMLGLENSDLTDRDNFKALFFSQLEGIVTASLHQSGSQIYQKSSQPEVGVAKALMAELISLKREYPNETKDLMDKLAEHPGLSKS